MGVVEEFAAWRESRKQQEQQRAEQVTFNDAVPPTDLDEPGFINRAFADVKETVKNWAVGGVQGINEVARAQRQRDQAIMSGTTEDAKAADQYATKAQRTFVQETVSAPVMAGSLVAPPLLPVAGAIMAGDVYETVKEEGIGKAIRDLTYGPAKDFIMQQDLSKQLQEKPVSTIGTGAMALVPPILIGRAGYEAYKARKARVEPTLEPVELKPETVAQEFKEFREQNRQAADVLAIGEKQLNKPYELGADGFDATDCGKFTQDVFKEAGVKLDMRTADGQYHQMEREGKTFTDAAQLKEGDLVFFDVPSNRARWEPSNDVSAVFNDNQSYKGISHVGIYAGDGKVLQAGSSGVKYADINAFGEIVAYGRPLEKAANAIKSRPYDSELAKVEDVLKRDINTEIEPVSPAFGMSIKETTKAIQDPSASIKFSDPAIEARWQEASKGVQREPLMSRIREAVDDFAKKATRVYEDLPNNAEFSQLKNSLLKLEKQKGVAGDRTARLLQGITIKLDKPGLDLFTRKVVLDDLAQSGDRLPFGFTPETLAKEKSSIDNALKSDPKLTEAIKKRQEVWNAIKNDYSNAMKDIGFDVSERLGREDYFRHQVLEYANLRAITGSGQKLKTPTNRGFLREREGSIKDINANYLQAEFEVMAQMMYDTELAKTIKEVDNVYNIRKKLTGEHGDNWRDNIPEGYTTWQPREGSSFYIANSIPEKLASKLLEGAMEEVGVSPDQVRQVLAKGAPFKEMVVKQEVADTLNKISTPATDNTVVKVAREITGKWKQFILFGPTRFIKYELRNVTGDLDVTFAMNRDGFKYVKQATNELYQTIYGDRAMTAEMGEWFRRGGMETTSLVNELPDINRLRMFDKFAENPTAYEKFKSGWEKYWSEARNINSLREGILRYSNYLSFLDQMKKSPDGKPKTFAASIPEEIMALPDIRDRAFKLSNEMMGAYDSVSVLGKNIRDTIYPFWSFAETNFSRYKQFFKNETADGNLGSAVTRKLIGTALIRSPYYAARVGSFAVKAGAFWAMLQAYNNLFFAEEEKELPLDEQARPHIVLGRDENGKVKYFSRLGVFSDFLEWFGLDTPVKDVRDFLNGSRSMKEIVTDIVKSPVNKAVQGVSPVIKVPGELISGRKLFPDMFNPMPLRDRGQYLADSLGLGNEFKALSKTPLAKAVGVEPRPSRPYLSQDTGENLLYYKAQPGQSSYYGIAEKKREYLKDIGKGGDGDFSSPKTDALRNYKLALRLKDTESAMYYLEEYKRLGGTKQGLNKSLEAMHPLAGLSQSDKTKFKKTLNGEQLQELEKAIQYYKTYLLGKE